MRSRSMTWPFGATYAYSAAIRSSMAATSLASQASIHARCRSSSSACTGTSESRPRSGARADDHGRNSHLADCVEQLLEGLDRCGAQIDHDTLRGRAPFRVRQVVHNSLETVCTRALAVVLVEPSLEPVPEWCVVEGLRRTKLQAT